MDELNGVFMLVAGVFGLVAGYFLGYRTGAVSGELDALKSLKSSRGRETRSARGSKSKPDPAELDSE